jgi:CBS domain-containing protein
MQQLPVSELMRNCSHAVVSETIRLRDAAELLVTNGFSVLVVKNACGQLVGVIPESAVIRKLMATTCHDASVSQILSRHVESVRQDASIGGILHLFRSSCHEVIPVLDQAGEIVGLLHRRDIVRMLLSDAAEPTSEHNSGGALPDGYKPHFMNREGLPKKTGEKKQPPGSAESS